MKFGRYQNEGMKYLVLQNLRGNDKGAKVNLIGMYDSMYMAEAVRAKVILRIEAQADKIPFEKPYILPIEENKTYAFEYEVKCGFDKKISGQSNEILNLINYIDTSQFAEYVPIS